MTIKAIGRMILVVILLAAFTLFTFTIPVLRTTGFWLAYIFGVYAILYQLYVISEVYSKKNREGVFYSFPAARMGFYYLVIQLAASVTEIILARTTSGKAAILVNGLILAFPIIGFITTETVREEQAAQERKNLRKE